MRALALFLIGPAVAACGAPPFDPSPGVNVEVTSCASCGIWEPMASGGQASLRITHVQSLDDSDFVDTRLVSSAPGVVEVVAYRGAADAGFGDIVAVEPGLATLLVLTNEGDVIDTVPIEVRLADRLALTEEAPESTAATPVTVTRESVPGFDHAAAVPPGTLLAFDSILFGGADLLRGSPGLSVDLPDTLALVDPAALATGRFAIRVPAGDHVLFVQAVGHAPYLRIRLSGR